LGAALIYAIRASHGWLGLPEVVGDEIEKQITKAGQDAADAIEKGFATIERIVGSRSAYSLPSQDVMRGSVSARLAELDLLVKHVPFTLEHAKAALHRVNEETPLNGPKNQQFKDSAIWEAVLELARDHIVHFVTGDKGFFQGREPSRGLAQVLKDEVERNGGTVEVYEDLPPCLALLRREIPPVDETKLGAAIDKAIRGNIADSAAGRSFQLLEHVKTKVEAFLTERASVLSLAFEVTYQLEDAEGREGLGRTEAMAFARGDGSYSLESRVVTDFRMNEVEFVWRDENLDMQRNKNVYVWATDGILGGGFVAYTLHTPLAEGEKT
jgi:hypothetical protein